MKRGLCLSNNEVVSLVFHFFSIMLSIYVLDVAYTFEDNVESNPRELKDFFLLYRIIYVRHSKISK